MAVIARRMSAVRDAPCVFRLLCKCYWCSKMAEYFLSIHSLTFCYAPEGTSGGKLKSHRPSVRPSIRPSVRPLQIVCLP